jgi:arsenate reductase-like glutaredoxin family protein
MRLWIDDVRPAPKGYHWAKTVREAIHMIVQCNRETDYHWTRYIEGWLDRENLEALLALWEIEVISCDNDLGKHETEGYKLLDWLEATGRNYPIHIHTANPVARERMRAIIERNGWTEVR